MGHPIGEVEEMVDSGRGGENLWRLAYYRAIAWGQFQGGFLARTAHELRSPLSRTISLHQMILEDLCDDIAEEHQFVAQANTAALQLLDHLDFLTRLSRIEGGSQAPRCQALPLAPVFQSLQELTHLQAQNRSLRLEIIPPAPAVTVWADGDWLLQILVLLVEGAIATSPRGAIHLEVTGGEPTRPNPCTLWLWDNRPADSWQEPACLPETPPQDPLQPLPLGLRHSLALAMAKTMGGEIRLVAPPAPFSHGLRYDLPLAAMA